MRQRTKPLSPSNEGSQVNTTSFSISRPLTPGERNVLVDLPVVGFDGFCLQPEKKRSGSLTLTVSEKESKQGPDFSLHHVNFWVRALSEVQHGTSPRCNLSRLLGSCLTRTSALPKAEPSELHQKPKVCSSLHARGCQSHNTTHEIL